MTRIEKHFFPGRLCPQIDRPAFTLGALSDSFRCITRKDGWMLLSLIPNIPFDDQVLILNSFCIRNFDVILEIWANKQRSHEWCEECFRCRYVGKIDRLGSWSESESESELNLKVHPNLSSRFLSGDLRCDKEKRREEKMFHFRFINFLSAACVCVRSDDQCCSNDDILNFDHNSEPEHSGTAHDSNFCLTTTFSWIGDFWARDRSCCTSTNLLWRWSSISWIAKLSAA
jgi:hypothetical protein